MSASPYRFLRSGKFWLAVVGGWTAYGVILAQESYAFAQLSGGRVWPLGSYLGRSFLDVGMWYWATPLAVVLARRFRLTRSRWAGPLVLHLGFAVAVALGTALATYGLQTALLSRPSMSIPEHLLFQLDPGVFVYCGIVGLVHAVDFYRMYSDERVATATLRAGLSEARLQILSAQLQPHFLFNTLNVISELIHEDPERADGMIGRLGDLLRDSMSGAAAEEGGVPLERELATLRAYVELQQLRFRDRLDVSFEVAPEVMRARVPHFVLQPLVENAILHGSAGSTEALRVRITAALEDGLVQIRVLDDGRGVDWRQRRQRGGLGLRTVQARLGHMFGSDYRLALQTRSPRGVVSVLSFPFQEIGQPSLALS